MRIKKVKDDFTTWPETIESAKMMVRGLRSLGVEPSEFLLRLAGDTDDRLSKKAGDVEEHDPKL